MKSIENTKKLFMIIDMCRREATGTPAEFAKKLYMTERNLYRYLEFLKSIGINITYNRKLRSYVLKDEVNSINVIDKLTI